MTGLERATIYIYTTKTVPALSKVKIPDIIRQSFALSNLFYKQPTQHGGDDP